ncbi:MAG: hypothetical protein A2X99_00045 [Deltaproteobacteria bacterium GWB2_55_19]|nr:MAG: hypothetical protein A2X99_00045 [Deltaproteobacteria bacterium GWB2_55_19]HAO92406.1 chemotaxis protein CheW [Deltaproteobacteria bacterium]
MSGRRELLVFSLDALRCALSLSVVERVIPALKVSPLPNAPAAVRGVVNVRGRLIPVFDIRLRFNLPGRDVSPYDRLIFVRAGARTVALIADSVEGVAVCDEKDVVDPGEIVQGLTHIEGVAKLNDGVALIHDVARFLSIEEEKALDEALGGM